MSSSRKESPLFFVLLTVAALIVLVSCQKSGTPAAQQPAAAPPSPPPPPVTSQGKLVSVERADSVMATVAYLTTSGLRSETREKKAGTGKTYVVLHFEKQAADKPEAEAKSGMVKLSSGADGRLESKSGDQEGEQWVTDAEGKKYTEGIGVTTGDKAHLAYEIPVTATGLVWHDGAKAYQVEPKVVAIEAPPQGAAR